MSEFVFSIDTYHGAIELNRNYQKHFSRGLILAALFHLAAVGSYWGSIYFGQEEPPVKTFRLVKYQDLGPPPSIAGTSAAVAPSVSVASPAARPSVGIPVPVPDAEISPEQTFATQQELLEQVSPIMEGLGDGLSNQELVIEEPPPDFVPFEKAPVVVKRILPAYPDLARRAGLEGTVWFKIWVDKEGKVRDVVILKSDSEIFNQSVIDAVKQWVFTPALMSSGPVAVWVATSFSFKLRG